jgi:hypothetical protein
MTKKACKRTKLHASHCDDHSTESVLALIAQLHHVNTVGYTNVSKWELFNAIQPAISLGLIEQRDAKTGCNLVRLTARGVSIASTAATVFQALLLAQIEEDETNAE